MVGDWVACTLHWPDAALVLAADAHDMPIQL